MDTAVADRVGFRHTSDATAEDWVIVERAEAAYAARHNPGERLLRLMRTLCDEETVGLQVNLYQHCLQSATHAFRAGADDELIVVALFHDLAEALTDNDHGLVMAHILWPWISEARAWLLAHHREFQSYHFANHPTRSRTERDKYIGHKYYAETAYFCEQFDQNCFDPDFTTMALEEFEPIVRRFFARPRPARTPMPSSL